jgi:NADH dehydrogenase [ubiquinone] 1 alpha subcomplex assembly factor 5
MFSTTIRQLTKQSGLLRRQYVATPQAFHVFNRDVKRLQKDRAASKVEESRTVDYLKDEIAARVADRLLVTNLVLKVVPFKFSLMTHCLLGH